MLGTCIKKTQLDVLAIQGQPSSDLNYKTQTVVFTSVIRLQRLKSRNTITTVKKRPFFL